ncbi:MAG: FAD:protein FMN transferase, partial [Oscillospiraceae bacterium]
MKKTKSWLLLAVVLGLTALSCHPPLRRYTVTFWGVFDTVIQITAESPSEEEFHHLTDAAMDRFTELSHIYDRFREYDGIVNLASLNIRGQTDAVVLPHELFDLLSYMLQGRDATGGVVDPAMGRVTDAWRQCILASSNDAPKDMPDPAALLRAANDAKGNVLALDHTAQTARLSPGILLDVGAVAKGYATELVGRELTAAGLTRLAISSGGNVRVFAPPEGRLGWHIGVQNPNMPILGDAPSLANLLLSDLAVATSGDYQRFFWLNGQRIHHIINPKTLWPANHYRAVTVVAPDAAMADL